jgi:hypothetical protein
MVNDAIPYFEDGDELTATATVAVTGKRFVRITGDLQADGTLSCGPAAAGAVVLGVAMYDAAIGRRFTLHTINSGNVVPVTAGAALVAGTRVASDATGQAVAAAGGAPALGIVLTGCAQTP